MQQIPEEKKNCLHRETSNQIAEEELLGTDNKLVTMITSTER